MNVSGAWKGQYTFEEVKPKEDAGDKPAMSPTGPLPTVSPLVIGTTVNFTLELKQGWLGNVSGTITEDPRTGFPEPGKIKGRCKGNILDFRKYMPVVRMIHEPSRLTLEQWAERRKMVVDATLAHPSILYMGDISDDGNTVEGTWRAVATSLDVPGSYNQAYLPLMGGTWKITRA
jgi:hypothetical protein